MVHARTVKLQCGCRQDICFGRSLGGVDVGGAEIDFYATSTSQEYSRVGLCDSPRVHIFVKSNVFDYVFNADDAHPSPSHVSRLLYFSMYDALI